MSLTDLAALRGCLPNIRHLPDSLLLTMSPTTLIDLNRSLQPLPDQSFHAAAAAAAAYFGGQSSSAQDPGMKMRKNFERVQANPAHVPEGLDDRFNTLHEARFLGGAVGMQ